jgi:protoporphyrinogen oxidase
LIRVRRKPLSFEDWVTRQFGRRLFRIFFKTYTEKVWGMPCSEISADWAAQRIKGLSLGSALRSALPSWLAGARGHIKTLIDEFDYPRLGPGQLWESAASQIRGRGGHIHMGSRVTRISLAGRRVGAVGSTRGLDEVIGMDGAVISTMPIRDLIQVIDPPPPIAVSEAASALRYRDFLTVVIILDKSEVFPDNWIYIHEPEVRVGRIQNFRNWSPDMVADQATTSLGLEYFCHEGDTLWSSTDDALIELAISELERIGLLGKANVVTGAVVRMPKAYPVYDATYKANVSLVREWLREHATNLQLVGRNGMHMYNNQDHSMLAAYLAARNLLGEEWDPWLVNADAEYHEETGATDSVGRFVPQRLIRP